MLGTGTSFAATAPAQPQPAPAPAPQPGVPEGLSGPPVFNDGVSQCDATMRCVPINAPVTPPAPAQ
jgi:hypothetical protein